jgi:hypothetical protein
MEFVVWIFSDVRTYIFLFAVLVVTSELVRRRRKNKSPRIAPEDYWASQKKKED